MSAIRLETLCECGRTLEDHDSQGRCMERGCGYFKAVKRETPEAIPLHQIMLSRASIEDLEAELERRKNKDTHSPFPWHAEIDKTVEDRVWRRRPLAVLDARSVTVAKIAPGPHAECNTRILSTAGDGIKLARAVVNTVNAFPTGLLSVAEALLKKAGL